MYNTLEEIQQRKQQLQANIRQHNEQISTLWAGLTTQQEPSSKGELVANLVSNSVTAIDAFLLVRKLMKSYSWLFKRKKRK
jgi:hypothetical protein